MAQVQDFNGAIVFLVKDSIATIKQLTHGAVLGFLELAAGLREAPKMTCALEQLHAERNSRWRVVL